jgi:hypothetical protein
MAKSKTHRDPNAPKRNLSAYLLYQNAMRDTFKGQNPGMTFGQLSKYTSAMYAEMPPHEKEQWQARAEADKGRYLMQMASYVPTPGFDSRGEAVLTPTTKRAIYKGKGSRDPNAPKRNLSAYLLYQNAMRNQFKADNPGMTFGQLSKYTSHMYKALTPEEKAEWDQKAMNDKVRYDTAMKSYVPPMGYDSQGSLIVDKHAVATKRVKKVKDPNAPKRARGSFVFFTFEMRPKIMLENPDVKFVELGTIMGERWRALTPEEKMRFEEMANMDKIRFANETQVYNAQKAEAVARAHVEMSQVMPMPQNLQQYQIPQSYMDPAAQAYYDSQPAQMKFDQDEAAAHHENVLATQMTMQYQHDAGEAQMKYEQMAAGVKYEQMAAGVKYEPEDQSVAVQNALHQNLQQSVLEHHPLEPPGL